MAGAVITALATTIVSFLPVFAMQAAEGKLFKPLAFTKTFAMLSALLIGLVIIPTLAHLVFSIRFDKNRYKKILNLVLAIAGLAISILRAIISPCTYLLWTERIFQGQLAGNKKSMANILNIAITRLIIVFFLTRAWMPLGAQNTFLDQLFVCYSIVGVVLGHFNGRCFLSENSELGSRKQMEIPDHSSSIIVWNMHGRALIDILGSCPIH